MAKQLVMLRKRGPFLVHVDEDFAQRAVVLVFAGAQVDLVIADAGLLRVAGPAIRQAAAVGDVAVDDLLGNLDRLGHEFLGLRVAHRSCFVAKIGDRVERLAQLGAVAVQGVGLEHQLPAQMVGLLDVLDAWPSAAC